LNAASNGKLQFCDNLLPPECDYALMIQWHPASSEVIYKCQGNQEKQPNYACYDYQMQKAAASLDLHKERGDFSTPGER
jgi:hypothetical protein